MNPIREVSKVERLMRAMLVIEGLVLQHSGEDLADKIYCLAHVGLGQCGALNLDKKDGCSAWFEEIEKAEQSLQKSNTIDVEKHYLSNLDILRDKLADLLKSKNQKVVFAESCTAGLCAATLAQIDGISQHLCGSAVTYRPEVKEAWLDVKRETIDDHTCESINVGSEMALNVLEKTPEANWSASVVGIIGKADDWFVYISVAHRTDVCTIKALALKSIDSNNRIDRQREAVELVYSFLIDQMNSHS